MSMKRVARHRRSFLRGRRHRRGIVVTSGALGARDQTKIGQAAMFLMTRRAGSILNYVRFVKVVLLMTNFTFAIDRFDGDAVAETIAQNFAKLSANGGVLVTFRAIVFELGVRGRDFSGVEKFLRAAVRINENDEQPAKDRQQADDESRAPPGMEPAIVTEIAFVALGDLLLRATGFGHRLSN